MSLTLKELKDKHEKAYISSQQPREDAANDLIFFWVSQWSDDFLQSSNLQYRGQFDVLRKAARDIIAGIRSNPVQVDFEPLDDNREDGAELLDGMYRSDARTNQSLEAKNYAVQDSIVCGYGAWERYTEYETNRAGDENQVIKRRWIPEANNTAFVDPNAKFLDKSDAKYWSVLSAYSEEGYKDLVEELTGERPVDNYGSSFSRPEESYTFPWYTSDKKIYITRFYNKTEVKDKVYTLVDPMGAPVRVRESDFSEFMDELIASGHEVVSEKEIKRIVITMYTASGQDILKEEVIAGELIPVIPVYGERAIVEGVETWEGITRLAKDPQRLRNFQLSYLADIVSRSPRNKPIVTPEMVAKYEFMYEENGADNSYPYYLMNSADENGNPILPAPMSELPEQKVPTALIQSVALSREAIEDVASPALPQNIADPDLSGKAVIALQNQIDRQSYVYQDNLKHSERYDGAVYASMAADIMDTPRTVTVTMPDGSRKKMQTMSTVFDDESGESKVINDLSNAEFEVYADIGQSFSNRREQTIEELDRTIDQLPPGDPKRDLMVLKKLELIDGVNFDDIRKYARQQLMLQGLKEPETPEEEQWLMSIQSQPKEPDAAMQLAMAENKKGDAALMREQRENFKTSADVSNDQAQTEIDRFEAETDRMNTQIDATKVGAEINYKRMEAFTKRLDSTARLRSSLQ